MIKKFVAMCLTVAVAIALAGCAVVSHDANNQASYEKLTNVTVVWQPSPNLSLRYVKSTGLEISLEHAQSAMANLRTNLIKTLQLDLVARKIPSQNKTKLVFQPVKLLYKGVGLSGDYDVFVLNESGKKIWAIQLSDGESGMESPEATAQRMAKRIIEEMRKVGLLA